MAYANGQIPSSARSSLVTAPGQQLVGAAARQWDALAQSVRSLYGWTPALTDSYRPYAVQERIFLQRYDHQYRSGLTLRNGGIKHWRDRTWYKKPGVAVAATPGTSNHGWGKAVDVTGLGGFSGARYRQLATLAARFGFSNANGRAINEPWHWEFTGSYTVDNPIGGGGSVTVPNIPGAPAPIIPEDDMPYTEAQLRQFIREEVAQGLLVSSRASFDKAVAEAVLVKSANTFRALVGEVVAPVAEQVATCAADAAQARAWGGTVYNTLTPGVAGVKSEGTVFGMLRQVAPETAALVAARDEQAPVVDAKAIADQVVSAFGPELAVQVRDALTGLTATTTITTKGQ